MHRFDLPEDGLTDDRRVVATPANNHRIQSFNQELLSLVLMAASRPCELSNMAFDRRLAWLDEEFEPKPSFLAVLTRLVFGHRVLSDIEAEEVEARFSIHCCQ